MLSDLACISAANNNSVMWQKPMSFRQLVTRGVKLTDGTGVTKEKSGKKSEAKKAEAGSHCSFSQSSILISLVGRQASYVKKAQAGHHNSLSVVTETACLPTPKSRRSHALVPTNLKSGEAFA